MKLFAPLYERAIAWSKHPHAPRFLVGLSFVEAFIFPVAPEIMLAPMCLAQPKRGFRFAAESLAGSLVGSLIGYALGHYAYEAIQPLLGAGMQQTIATWVDNLRTDMAQHWLAMLGALTLAALQPVIPMKFVAWAAGIVGVPIFPFLACMAVGRGKRVFLVAGAIRWGAEKAEAALRRHVEWIGWAAMGLLAVGGLWLYLHGRGG